MKKYLNFLLVFVLTFSLVGCSKPNASQMQKEFDKFVAEDLKDSVEDNYSLYHIFFENPEDYGFEKENVDVEIGKVYSDEVYEELREEVNEFEDDFKKFDRDLLTDTQQDIYDQMSFDLSIDKEMCQEKFDYMYNYFEPMSGVQYSFESFFADFKMRNEQDVQDYIQLMKSFKPYIDEVLTYTKKQAEMGLMSIDFDSVLERVNTVISLGDKSSIVKLACQHVQDLKLNNKKTEEYKKQIKDVFVDSYLYSMKSIQKTLNELKSKKNNTEGLAKLKNGKEYYEVLYKQTLGSHRSIDDMKKLLSSYAQASLKEIMNQQIKNPNIYEDVNNSKTHYTNYKDIVEDLNKMIKNDFPSFGDIDYHIEPLSKDLANPGIAAYFNIPALDSTKPREMFVNTNKYSSREDAGNTNTISTFLTVAHEGIPGHMYQYDHYYNSQKSDWIKLQKNDGFVEGYATYVETQAINYLNKDVKQDVIDYQKNETVFLNCVIALFDIAIHYDGLSHEEALQFLTDHGLNTSEDLYKQIQSNPTAFIPYYAGYIEIMELRQKAENELGNRFKAIDFHNALLKTGSVCFDIIEKDIDDYIEEIK